MLMKKVEVSNLQNNLKTFEDIRIDFVLANLKISVDEDKLSSELPSFENPIKYLKEAETLYQDKILKGYCIDIDARKSIRQSLYHYHDELYRIFKGNQTAIEICSTLNDLNDYLKSAKGSGDLKDE